MLGSSISVAGPNVILNTAVAEALKQFYEELKDTPADEMESAVHALVKRAILKHKRVIFNGNGYTDEWIAEAEKRGLYNYKSTPEVLPCFIAQKNIDLFTQHHIFTESEVHSRYEILLENYCKTLHIEAKTLSDMIKRDFLPALMTYCSDLTSSIINKKTAAGLTCNSEVKLLTKLSGYYDEIFDREETLEDLVSKAEGMEDLQAQAEFYHDTILTAMDDIRTYADLAETYIPDDILPYPNYEKLLFSL